MHELRQGACGGVVEEETYNKVVKFVIIHPQRAYVEEEEEETYNKVVK
jgi:hypothetical protein